MLRKLLSVPILALALAGNAMAGTWSGPNNTGIQHFPVGNSTDQMLIHYGYDSLTGRPTWTGAFGLQSSTHFDAKTFVARNGQPLGGTYRSPLVTENVDDISVRWQSFTDGNLVDFPRSELGTLRLANDPTQALSRTVIETGNPPPNPLKNYHPNGWYWEPSASGTGVGIDIRGDTLFATFFTYDAAGNDDWYFTTATMTSNSLYSAQLRHCSKATGTVVCSDVGQVNMTFFLANSLFPTTYRIAVTLPPAFNNATMTLRPYSR